MYRLSEGGQRDAYQVDGLDPSEVAGVGRERQGGGVQDAVDTMRLFDGKNLYKQLLLRGWRKWVVRSRDGRADDLLLDAAG